MPLRWTPHTYLLTGAPPAALLAAARGAVGGRADTYAPFGTYELRVPASRVGYVPDAQGGLPQEGPTVRTGRVRSTRTSLGRYVPRTLATQVGGRARRLGGSLASVGVVKVRPRLNKDARLVRSYHPLGGSLARVGVVHAWVWRRSS